MTLPLDRPPAKTAGPELLVIAHFEEFSAWFLDHAAKWPRSARFTLTQRVLNHVLDIMEALVTARWDRLRRPALLHDVNLTLERLRFLLRLALTTRVMPKSGFETAMRGLDTTGKMVHGWRRHVGGGQADAGHEARAP